MWLTGHLSMVGAEALSIPCKRPALPDHLAIQLDTIGKAHEQAQRGLWSGSFGLKLLGVVDRGKGGHLGRDTARARLQQSRPSTSQWTSPPATSSPRAAVASSPQRHSRPSRWQSCRPSGASMPIRRISSPSSSMVSPSITRAVCAVGRDRYPSRVAREGGARFATTDATDQTGRSSTGRDSWLPDWLEKWRSCLRHGMGRIRREPGRNYRKVVPR